MKTPQTLSHDALSRIVADIVSVMYVDGSNTEWSAETIEEVAQILHENDLVPE